MNLSSQAIWLCSVLKRIVPGRAHWQLCSWPSLFNVSIYMYNRTTKNTFFVFKLSHNVYFHSIISKLRKLANSSIFILSSRSLKVFKKLNCSLPIVLQNVNALIWTIQLQYTSMQSSTDVLSQELNTKQCFKRVLSFFNEKYMYLNIIYLEITSQNAKCL